MAETHVHQAPNGGNGGRGGLYALLAIIIVLIVLAIVLFLPGRGGDGTRDIDADIRIETPDLPDRNGGQSSPTPDGGGQP